MPKKTSRFSLWSALMVIGLAFAAAGCANDLVIPEVANWEKARTDGGRSIVVGRLRFVDFGRIRMSGQSMSAWVVGNPWVRDGSREFRTWDRDASIDSEGHFRWSLPAGIYNVRAVAEGAGRVYLDTTFSVPQNGKVYYIGTLQVAENLLTIEDELDEERSYLSSKLGFEPGAIEKSLLSPPEFCDLRQLILCFSSDRTYDQFANLLTIEDELDEEVSYLSSKLGFEPGAIEKSLLSAPALPFPVH